MPIISQAQRRLMHAAAKDPKVRKRTGVSAKVAREFVKSDKPGKLPERKSTEERWYGGKSKG